MPSRRHALQALLAAALLVAATAMALVSTASATGTTGPSYRATLAPTTAAAGTTATSTITLTQLNGKALRSVRITPPAGFTLTSATAVRGSYALTATIASGAVTINDVDLSSAGTNAVVTLKASIPCGTSGARTWSVVGHSTSSYNASSATTLLQDPSSTLTTTVAPCSLAFAAQPAAAGAAKVITSQAANPAGAPMTVQLRDGNGSPAAIAGSTINLSIASGTGTSGALLGGTTSSATVASGLASFAPTIDRAGHAYQLTAQAAAGITPATSSPFEISDVATACTGACSASAQSGAASASISANSTGVLSASFGLDSISCNNAVNRNYVVTSPIVTFDVTGSTSRTTVTMKVAAASVTKLWFKYEICFSSPNSAFVNAYGASIPAGQAGILPSCFDWRIPAGGPCVVLKWFDFHGNVYLMFSVPAGDPRGGF